MRHFMRAGLVDGRIRRAIVLRHDIICEHPGLDFLAADVREHSAIDLHAWAEHLAALLNHFLPLQWVVDDITVLKGQVVFVHYGANALAPTAGGFQIGNNFRLFHSHNRI